MLILPQTLYQAKSNEISFYQACQIKISQFITKIHKKNNKYCKLGHQNSWH